MEPRRPHATGLARGLTALVLALFVLGLVGERAHVAFEAHAYCAEHQRYEHAHGGPLSTEHSIDVHEDCAAGIAFEAQDGEDDAHEACGHVLGRDDEPVVVESVPTRAFLVDADGRAPGSVGHDTSALGARSVVRFAPKHSPPEV